MATRPPRTCPAEIAVDGADVLGVPDTSDPEPRKVVS